MGRGDGTDCPNGEDRALVDGGRCEECQYYWERDETESAQRTAGEGWSFRSAGVAGDAGHGTAAQAESDTRQCTGSILGMWHLPDDRARTSRAVLATIPTLCHDWPVAGGSYQSRPVSASTMPGSLCRMRFLPGARAAGGAVVARRYPTS